MKVSVAASGYGNVLKLNVDPDRGRASHTVRVQFAPEGDDFMDLGEPLQTLGSAETRTLTLAAGSYRVVVPASGRYGLAVSRVLVLTDPTVKVKAARSGYGDVLSVDVDPDRGSGYWTFQVEKQNDRGTWTKVTSTRRRSEPRRRAGSPWVPGSSG